MSDIERKNTTINEGYISEAILNSSKPTLNEMREKVITDLKVIFRDGTHSYEKLLALTAQLCLLDDFENKLRSKIRRGNYVLKETYDGK